MKTKNTNTKIQSLISLFRFIIFHAFYFTAFSSLEREFSYDEETGRGPSKWAELDPKWYECGNGTKQSPIPISDLTAQLRFDIGCLETTNYRPANATLYNRGHDIQVDWTENAGSLSINGMKYELTQAHWHIPSEHTINRVRFEAELHLVHQSNSTGQIAVIGLVYKYGPPDPFVNMLYNSIIGVKNGTKSVELGCMNPEVAFQYYPSRFSKYYRYNGSLTTPPCSQTVVWTIIKRVHSISFWQVEALKAAVEDGFKENARPLQPLNGRPVYKFI